MCILSSSWYPQVPDHWAKALRVRDLAGVVAATQFKANRRFKVVRIYSRNARKLRMNLEYTLIHMNPSLLSPNRLPHCQHIRYIMQSYTHLELCGDEKLPQCERAFV